MTRTKRGKTLFEVLIATVVVGVLASSAFLAVKGVRGNAECVVVVEQLKQIHQAMELYYNKFHAYPPEDSNLKVALREFTDENDALWAHPYDKQKIDVISTSYTSPDTATITMRILGSPCGDMKYVSLYKNGKIKVFQMQPEDCKNCDGDGQIEENDRDEGQDEGQGDLNQDDDNGGNDDGGQIGDDDGDQDEGGGDQIGDAGEDDDKGNGGDDETGDDGESPGDDGDDDVIDVDDGTTTFKTKCEAYVRVIGSDFTYANGKHVWLSATAYLDGKPKLVGDPAKPGTGFTQEVEPGTRLTMKCEIKDPYTRWLWGLHGWPVVFRSDDRSGQCLTVVKGDQVPVYAPGYPCQQPVHEMLKDFVDENGIVTIKSNEVLWLFDANYVGDDPWKLDYNDLVVLATAVAVEEVVEDDGDSGDQPTEETNRPPTVTFSSDPIDARVGEWLVLADYFTTSDPDGDTLKVTFGGWKSERFTKYGKVKLSSADVGDHQVVVYANDGKTLTSASATIRVLRTNNRPRVSFTTSPIVATVGQWLNIRSYIKASDPDGDNLTYSYSGWKSYYFSRYGGLNPKITDVGTHSLTVRVSDGKLSSSASVAITVQRPNAPPTVSFTSNPITAQVGSWLYIKNYISASDADGDSLTYTFSGWKSSDFTRYSRTKPTSSDVGSHRVTVTVSDGKSEASASAIIKVQRPNRPPVVRFTRSSITLNIGSWLVITRYLRASDPDGDKLTYKFSGWKSNYFNRYRKAKATSSDVGNHTVRVRVSDGKSSASATLVVRVAKKNRPPTLSFTQNPIRARAYRWLHIRNYIRASDPDGDKLTYKFSGWKSYYFNRYGAYKPRWRDRGWHTVKVTVSDGKTSVTKSVRIRVTLW